MLGGIVEFYIFSSPFDNWCNTIISWLGCEKEAKISIHSICIVSNNLRIWNCGFIWRYKWKLWACFYRPPIKPGCHKVLWRLLCFTTISKGFPIVTAWSVVPKEGLISQDRALNNWLGDLNWISLRSKGTKWSQDEDCLFSLRNGYSFEAHFFHFIVYIK